MKKLTKWLTLLFCMGFIYLGIEVVFRAIAGELVGIKGLTYMSLGGWTTLWMIPVGGICGLALGFLNEIKTIKTYPILVQCIIGTAIVLTIEFVFGLIFNVWLGLALWSYEEWACNLLGQVCLPFAAIWFFICPFAFWLDDFLRFAFYGEDSKYHLWEPYKKLFLWQ